MGGTPSRRALRSASRIITVPSRFTLLLAALLLLGCDSTEYDFGLPGASDPPSTDGAVCEDIVPIDAGCGAVSWDAGCHDVAAVETVVLGESLGCTPPGQALGVVALGAAATDGKVALYAWAEPTADGGAPFDETVSLAPFRDACGDDPVGSELQCEYRPWLFKRSTTVDDDRDLMLHVQTAEAREAVPIGYQLHPVTGWDVVLLAGEPIACHALSPFLADHPPWDGAPRALDLTHVPPPLDGVPWMCGGGAAGWRQAAYLLRNGTDDDLRITRIGLFDEADEQPVPFHFGFHRCHTTGEVDPIESLQVSSCHDDGEHTSKEIDLLIEMWIPDVSTTEYALILQVPPSAGASPLLVLDVEPAEKH